MTRRHPDYDAERYREIAVDENDLHDIDYETERERNHSLFEYAADAGAGA